MLRPKINFYLQAANRYKHSAILLLLTLFAVYNFGSGTWIYAKAWLAQQMIATAWEKTLIDLSNNPPWSWADTWPIARLQAPGHNEDLMVLASASGESLAFGPGHLMGSSLPGALGTSVIAGHRDTHFAFLEHIEPGDLLRIQDKQGQWYEYEVETTAIVNQRTQPLEINEQTKSLILVTCYPFASLAPGGDLRFIVYAKPLETGTLLENTYTMRF